MNAPRQITVPKISIIIRKTYGMALWNMVGAGCTTDFLLACRRSRDEFRGPGDCIQHRLWGKAAKPPKLNDQKEQLLKQMIEDNASYPAAGMHYIHDVIYPLEIRDYIIRALEICQDRRTGSVSEHRMANWPTKF